MGLRLDDGNNLFSGVRGAGEESIRVSGQRRNMAADGYLQIAGVHIVAVYDQHFLDAARDIEVSLVKESQVAGFIEIAVVAF